MIELCCEYLSVCSYYFTPASSKEFLDIQATIECGFTLKHVHDMIRTYSQIKFCDNSKAFIEHSNDMDDIYKNIQEYNTPPAAVPSPPPPPPPPQKKKTRKIYCKEIIIFCDLYYPSIR